MIVATIHNYKIGEISHGIYISEGDFPDQIFKVMSKSTFEEWFNQCVDKDGPPPTWIDLDEIRKTHNFYEISTD